MTGHYETYLRLVARLPEWRNGFGSHRTCPFAAIGHAAGLLKRLRYSEAGSLACLALLILLRQPLRRDIPSDNPPAMAPLATPATVCRQKC